MAQYYTAQDGYRLKIEEKYINTLDVEAFSQMLNHPSYCYKFYWLEAVVGLITEGTEETTFDEIIDEMIVNAWYSVREFHIHLSGLRADGVVRDALENAVMKLAELSGLASGASSVEIKNAIKEYSGELREYKKQLTNMVPWRALSGFLGKSNEKIPWKNTREMTEFILWVNGTVMRLPYTFGESGGLEREVYFSREWMRMIQDNAVNILGWIQYRKVMWLQNNNPEVPGLIYKLKPMDEKKRKMCNVRKLWDGVMEFAGISDVFTGRPLAGEEYDLDHFIPWSFVMNDELWNLMPMDPSLNSSKSNRLPRWEPFFPVFAENQYSMYCMVHEKENLHRLFENCYRDNIHSIWAGQELYRPGNTREEFFGILEKNMQPVYDSARRQGYEIWMY